MATLALVLLDLEDLVPVTMLTHQGVTTQGLTAMGVTEEDTRTTDTR